MKTIIAALFLQVVATDLPPATYRTSIVNGHVGVLRLDAKSCTGELFAFGTAWKCRPDHTLIVAVPAMYGMGPWAVTDRTGRPVAIVDVAVTAWTEERRPASKPRPAPPGRLEADDSAREEAYSAHENPRWSSHRLNLPLWDPLPAANRVTDPFGMRRFYGDAAEPVTHSGIDLAAPKPGAWNIRAPDVVSIAPGVVTLAQELWSSGNTVIVYHGDGVYSAYCHLDTMYVKPGNLVSSGAKLGVVGGTVGGGRIGKHLHFVLRINGIAVNPLESIGILNRELYLNTH